MALTVLTGAGDVAHALADVQRSLYTQWHCGEPDAIPPHFWAGLQLIGRTGLAPLLPAPSLREQNSQQLAEHSRRSGTLVDRTRTVSLMSASSLVSIQPIQLGYAWWVNASLRSGPAVASRSCRCCAARLLDLLYCRGRVSHRPGLSRCQHLDHAGVHDDRRAAGGFTRCAERAAACLACTRGSPGGWRRVRAPRR
jgi:hypothetical protein